MPGAGITAGQPEWIFPFTGLQPPQFRLYRSAALVVTAFFEELDSCVTTAGIREPGLTREDQLGFAAGRAMGTLVERFLDTPVPLPVPDLPYAGLLVALKSWSPKRRHAWAIISLG
ncbi:hypothetical protein AB0B24_13165 [Micromonospora parva]